MAKGVLKRGSVYQLMRRVPKRFATVEPRRMVLMSLKTDSDIEAHRRADAAWNDLLAGWETALAGDKLTGQALLDKARHDAQRLGIIYRAAGEVAELPVRELLDRLRVAAPDADPARVDPDVATATMGLAPVPVVTISGALEDYFELMKPELRDKTEDQIRRWRNPKKLAIDHLVEAVGDIPLPEFDHAAALLHRQHLLNWALEAERSQETARKLQTNAMAVLRKVNTLRGLGLSLTFDGLSIPASKDSPPRVSVGGEWIRDHILPAARPDGALGGLNDEARHIFLMLINTGARPSEVAGLKVKYVALGEGAEAIRILPDGRTLKNKNSARTIPLAGVSLQATRLAVQAAHERGAGPDDWLFPRYAVGGTLSAAMNKFLRANGLLPEGAVAYGLRHGFEDRMIESGIADRVRADLFGHAIQRERYGDGGGDAVRRRAVQAIAL
ncbi:MAG: site-specific integrase [Antarcticimicrobium sp.]|uniref:site-specific integrase n=1 Tax=Antarcticimicrobium sp. TaxID=2824147 RepID=UPI00261996B3|nr:site-specific integrase [Antarcticimicrobium sp.]MDF1719034.1 site-specific integrase [Antarcticimicrobium sp.]